MEVDINGSRQEPGCLRFDLLKSQSAENKFTFYEAYVDADALAFHKEQPHYKAWAAFKESGGVISQNAEKYDGLNF